MTAIVWAFKDRATQAAYGIAPNSAIVSRDETEPEVFVWYEGAIHGQQMTFEEKVLHAAGRMFERYPTIAKTVVRSGALRKIGEWDEERQTYTPVSATDREIAESLERESEFFRLREDRG